METSHPLMIKRIVEIGNPARLSLSNQQLVIERQGQGTATVPVEDLGLLILDHQGIAYTQAVMSACWKHNVHVLLCDDKHLPGAVLLPLDGHSLQSRTMAQQIKISEPVRKRLWQAIVRAKITGQARTLQSTKGSAGPLLAMAAKVRSGDPSNVEAQAARFYWQQLFGEDFRRGNDEEHLNGLLNYGYAIVRTACARALVGAGLHPSFGLHHHNQYNSFCLADDLVEPLRPQVDMTVYRLGRNGVKEGLTKEHKQSLLELLARTCSIGSLRLPLMESLHHYAASLRQVMCGEDRHLAIPEL